MAKVLFFLQLIVALIVLPLVPGMGPDFAIWGLSFLAVVIAVPTTAVLAVYGTRRLAVALADAWSVVPRDARGSAELWALASRYFPAAGLAAVLVVVAAALNRLDVPAPRVAAVGAFCLVWGLLGFLLSTVIAEVVRRLESGPLLAELSPTLGGRVGLTRREIEAAQAVLNGLTYRSAAQQLGVAPTTVKSHLLSVYQKTGAGNKIELLRWVEAETARIHQKANGRLVDDDPE